LVPSEKDREYDLCGFTAAFGAEGAGEGDYGDEAEGHCY
jgi:hypothetical protein